MASSQSTANYQEYSQHSNYQFPLDDYSTKTGNAATGTQNYSYNGQSGYGSNDGYTERQNIGTYGQPSTYNYGSYYGYQAPSGSTAPPTVASTPHHPPDQTVTWPATSRISAKEAASPASTLTSPPTSSAQDNSNWASYGYRSQYGSYGDQSSAYQTLSPNQSSQYSGYNPSNSYIQPVEGSSQSASRYSKLAAGSVQPAGAYGTQAAETATSFSGQNQSAAVYNNNNGHLICAQQSRNAQQLMGNDYSSMYSQPSQDSNQQANSYRQQPASECVGYDQVSSTYGQQPASKLGGYGQGFSTYGQQPTSKLGGYGQESSTYRQQPRSGDYGDLTVGYGQSSSGFGQKCQQEGGHNSQQSDGYSQKSSGYSPKFSGYSSQPSGYIQKTGGYGGSGDCSKVSRNIDDLLNPYPALGKQESFKEDEYQNNIGGIADQRNVSVGSSRQGHHTDFDRRSDSYQCGFGANKSGFEGNRGSLKRNNDEEYSEELCANKYSYDDISRIEGNTFNRGGGQNTKGELSKNLWGDEDENIMGGFGKGIGLSRGQLVQDETLYRDENGQQHLARGRYGQDRGIDKGFGEEDGRGFAADSVKDSSGDSSRGLAGNRGWGLDDREGGMDRDRARGKVADVKMRVVNTNMKNLQTTINKSTNIMNNTQGPDNRNGGISNAGSLGNSAPTGVADPKELDIAPETSVMPWTNTTSKLNEVLKRKLVPILESNEAKKKKEEDMIDVMPFIKAHVIENYTITPDARKLAEEALKKMMQPMYCVLCNARISGRPQAVIHYRGKTHANKIKNFITCCMTRYAENVKEYEIKTEEQKLKERQEEQKRNKPLDQKIAEARMPLDGHNPDFCKLCCMKFSSPLQANEHYSGKNHQKKLRQLNDPHNQESFGCEVCNVYVTSLEMLNLHYQGAKHKARMDRDRNYKKSDASKVVPLGGLVVDQGRSLRPGEVVPEGFIVKPYREPTRNEAFTSQFEGPDGFFSNDPFPIQIGPPFENDEESRSSKRRKHKQKHGHNFYNII